MNFDHIVIGAGAVGAAVTMHLALRGANVVALDRFGVPNVMGSSHGATRIVRMAYFEHVDYVPLLRAAYAGWRDIESRTRRRLLHLPGVVYAGPPRGKVVAGSRMAAEAHSIAHEILDGDALRRRFPMLKLPDDHIGLFEPEAGYVRGEAAIAAMMEIALRHGAQFRAPTRVTSIEPAGPLSGASPGVSTGASSGASSGGGVTVIADGERLHARTVIVAAGAWTADLLPTLGWPLTVTRQILAWVWPKRPDRFEYDIASPGAGGHGPPRLPCWGIECRPGSLHYGFPMATDGSTGLGLKFAVHAPGTPTDPEDIDRRVTDADLAELRTFIHDVIPDADGPIVDARVCLYTNTPDGNFALGRHPDSDRILVASPCSGHGFKFAPALGKALADLALDGGTSLPIDFLDARRFG